MRRLRAMTIAVPLLLLAACGGTKSTLTPIPSAGTQPSFATVSPTGIAVASAIAQLSDTPAAPSLPVSLRATPTPLAAQSVATPAPTKPPAATPVSATTPPRASQPAATPQPSKGGRVADIPSSSPQQVIGTTADGLTLLNLRTGKNDGFTRLVFDLSKQDGSAAPVPRTRLWMQGSTIIVAFGGVRDDVYAASLGGGEQRVDLGMVQSIYRIPARDDAAAAYGITVGGATHVTLSSLTLPTRIIVDIADK